MKKFIAAILIILTMLSPTCAMAKEYDPCDLDEADLLFVGDLLCLNAQLNAARSGGDYDFNYVFDNVRKDISGAEYAIGNLETCVAGVEAGLTTPSQKKVIVDENGNETEKTVALPKINAPYSYLDAIKEAGFDFLVTANNHTMDKGNAGVAATIEQIRQRALKHTGSSDSDDRNITVTEVDGINICILNYTMFINSGTQQPASVNTVNFYSLDAFKADITEARGKGAEYVIVYMHWGDEHKPITNIQRKTAKELADNGADLIIGSHPHILQPAEIIKTNNGNRSEVLCVYSLGNYISSMASTASRNTIMLHVKLRRWQSGRIDTVFAQYKPYVSGGRFEVAYPSEGAVQRISNTMGEKLTLVDNFQYG